MQYFCQFGPSWCFFASRRGDRRATDRDTARAIIKDIPIEDPMTVMSSRFPCIDLSLWRYIYTWLHHHHYHFICSHDTKLQLIYEQDRQGCSALTAAATQNLKQIHQYSKVHVITLKHNSEKWTIVGHGTIDAMSISCNINRKKHNIVKC